MLLSQYVLLMIAGTCILTLENVFKNPWVTIFASYFAISSGFCTHMWGGGSTDAMGLYSISIGLLFLSTLKLHWRQDWLKSAAVGMALALGMLSNSIYFFYFGFGLLASTLFLPFIRKPKLKLSEKIIYQFKVGFVSALVSGVLIAPWAIGFVDPFPKTIAGYETTLENTSPLHGPQLLVKRLQANGFRLSLDVALAGFGFITLLLFGSYATIAAAGSLFYIFVQLQADWITRWLWLPGYHVTLKPDAAWVTLPFVFRFHEPFSFSWISIDAFLALAVASLAYYLIQLSSNVLKKHSVWVPFVLAVLFVVIFPRRFWMEPFFDYPEGATVYSVPMDLVKYIRENTDKETTLILTPHYLQSRVEGRARSYGWAWLSPMTERETYEDRTADFVHLWNGEDIYTKAIAKDEKFLKIVDAHKNLYSVHYTPVQEGEFARLGITHAVIPRDYLDRIQTRRDAVVVFEYKDPVGADGGPEHTEGGVLVRFLAKDLVKN